MNIIEEAYEGKITRANFFDSKTKLERTLSEKGYRPFIELGRIKFRWDDEEPAPVVYLRKDWLKTEQLRDLKKICFANDFCVRDMI